MRGRQALWLIAAVGIAAPAPGQPTSLVLDYPPWALKAGIGGTVAFDVGVSPKGKVTDCKIVQTSGNARLDADTCDVLRHSARFKPAVDPDGRPIATRFASTLTWRPQVAGAPPPPPSPSAPVPR